MRTLDLLKKKRDGEELSPAEIGFLIRGICAGEIPDYQIAAFLMAVFFRGMSAAELAALTEEMRRSGSVLDLSDIPGRKVDKHSTGGVGDKTSLVLAPAVAAAGLTVPMISGRGLAHTGGTLDKLESIPGFQVRLAPEQLKAALRRVRAVLVGQDDNLVPADRKLYALRDVTATVDSRPLMAASIMSKKLAEDIDGLVLDVKTGSGAFARSEEDAEALARDMVGIGKAFGKKVVAVISDMSQPLGEYAGNALEVIECLEVLKGRGPEDLIHLCESLAAYCFLLGDAVEYLQDGRELFHRTIASGAALNSVREIIRIQGGNTAVVEDYALLPQARRRTEIAAAADGFVDAIDVEKMGWAINILGAGRETVESGIDHSVGLQVHKKIADQVQSGEALCTLYYNDQDRCARARQMIVESYSFSRTRPPRPALIRKIVT